MSATNFRALGWRTDEALQLVFLESYLQKEGKEDEFDKYITMFSENHLNVKQMQQIIKCIIHKLPLGWLENTIPSDTQMNEIRRFLEDTECYSENNPFVNIAKKLANLNLDPDSIYEYRRIWKSQTKLTHEQANMLFDFLTENHMWNWMIVSALDTIHKKTNDFDEMMNFAVKWNKSFKNNCINYDSITKMYIEAVAL